MMLDGVLLPSSWAIGNYTEDHGCEAGFESY